MTNMDMGTMYQSPLNVDLVFSKCPRVWCLLSCQKIGAKVASGKVSQTASSIRKERKLERESLEQIAFRNCTRRKQKFIFNIKVEHSEQHGSKRLI